MANVTLRLRWHLVITAHRRGLSLFVQLQLARDRHILQSLTRARIVEKVVRSFALHASFDFVKGVVSDVLQLDGSAVSHFVGVREASLGRCALLAHDEFFNLVRDAL